VIHIEKTEPREKGHGPRLIKPVIFLKRLVLLNHGSGNRERGKHQQKEDDELQGGKEIPYPFYPIGSVGFRGLYGLISRHKKFPLST